MSESKNVQSVFDSIVKLTVLEVKELLDKMEAELGVTPAVAAAPVAAVAAGAAAAAAEKTEFDVVMKSFGSNKLAVIKAVTCQQLILILKQLKSLLKVLAVVKQLSKKALLKMTLSRSRKTSKLQAGAEIVMATVINYWKASYTF